jgi:hypothetical protein
MKTHIEQHSSGLSVEHIRALWDNNVEGAGEILDYLSDERLDLVRTTFSQFEQYALVAHMLDRSDAAAYGWRRFARTVMSAGALTLNGDAQVAFETDREHEPLMLTATPGGDAFVSSSELMHGYFAALLFRDAITLQRFAALDVAALRSSGVSSTEQTARLAQLCQRMARGIDAAQREAAMADAAALVALCAPEPAALPRTQQYRVLITSCQAEIVFCMLDLGITPELANKALEEALRSHQLYASMGEAAGGLDPRDARTSFCLHANAFAAWMHDRGLPRTVTSGYLNETLIRGEIAVPSAIVR